MHCSSSGCSETPVVYLLSAKRNRCVGEQHLCKHHGEEFISHYYSVAYIGGRNVTGSDSVAHFDVELVAIEEGREQHGIYLRDVSGYEQFVFSIGWFEATALARNLKHEKSFRPLTHQAFADAIVALGGQLQDVLVDGFNDKGGYYVAKLRIQQMGRTVAVDVRPSDALSMAVLNDVPILISRDVVRSDVPHIRR
jgi:uncharacterized protein